jgi:hypothetical protein
MDKSKATPVPLPKGDKFSEAQCPKNQLESDEMKDIPYAYSCRKPDVCTSLYAF